jgi:hypothetical protein
VPGEEAVRGSYVVTDRRKARGERREERGEESTEVAALRYPLSPISSLPRFSVP